ncbi:MAG: hypothetical protein M1450_04850 [Patescibacteria group bacterium]|nr:hypothetical protein [Patescibacteria group bacterium]
MDDKNDNSTNNNSSGRNDSSANVKSDQTKNGKDKLYYTPLNSGNKFGVFFSSLSASNLVSLIFLVSTIVALPFVVFMSQTRQDLRQRASSGGAYLTVYPGNAYPGGKIIITENGPADCAEGLTAPEASPRDGLTSCELINASSNCTDNCQITWQCVAGKDGSYKVNVRSLKCNVESNLKINSEVK